MHAVKKDLINKSFVRQLEKKNNINRPGLFYMSFRRTFDKSLNC